MLFWFCIFFSSCLAAEEYLIKDTDTFVADVRVQNPDSYTETAPAMFPMTAFNEQQLKDWIEGTGAAADMGPYINPDKKFWTKSLEAEAPHTLLHHIGKNEKELKERYETMINKPDQMTTFKELKERYETMINKPDQMTTFKELKDAKVALKKIVSNQHFSREIVEWQRFLKRLSRNNNDQKLEVDAWKANKLKELTENNVNNPQQQLNEDMKTWKGSPAYKNDPLRSEATRLKFWSNTGGLATYEYPFWLPKALLNDVQCNIRYLKKNGDVYTYSNEIEISATDDDTIGGIQIFIDRRWVSEANTYKRGRKTIIEQAGEKKPGDMQKFEKTDPVYLYIKTMYPAKGPVDKSMDLETGNMIRTIRAEQGVAFSLVMEKKHIIAAFGLIAISLAVLSGFVVCGRKFFGQGNVYQQLLEEAADDQI